MTSAKFYMIYIDRNKDTTYEQIQKKIDLAVDWYRISEELWIVYTTSNEEKWYSRLKPFVKSRGHTFVCKLDVSHRQGWMTKGFWKWLRREEDET
jgi:hypothetical protein